jgi:hypothetical protein
MLAPTRELALQVSFNGPNLVDIAGTDQTEAQQERILSSDCLRRSQH